VEGTPTFFINGRRLSGAQPIETFRATIEEEIAKALALTARGVRPEDVYGSLMKNAVDEAPATEKRAENKAGSAKPDCEAPGGDCGCTGRDEEPESAVVEDVPLGAAPVRGPESAPVTIVEFADYDCPFCARTEATLKAIAQQYDRQVRIAFKNQPLPMHANARPAARAALAAAEQGKFWEYHDALFKHQGALDPASLEGYAKDLGLDVERFREAMASDRSESSVRADAAEATRLGVEGTPTFFVNGRKIVGAQPLPKFQSAVEAALREPRR
jgi:protein-disulfide isomerase